jgi:hypothetical protein
MVMLAGTLAALHAPVMAADEDTSEDVNSALGSISAHVNDIDKVLNLKFMGDVRTRWAFANQSGATNVTIGDSSRGRYRLRFGGSAKKGDFTGRFQLASGATNASPNSNNNTFDTAFTIPAINITQANLMWEPSFASGLFAITVGKMANPLTKTAITWDPDICPEGALLEVKKDDVVLRATYFELQNLFASGTTFGNMDLFMSNVQLEYTAKIDTDTSVGLMAGYEYIPNSTLLMSSGVTGTLGKNPITGFGGVTDPGGVARDWNNVEGMLTVKHKIADIPFKWYVHATDNLNGKNLPTATTGYTTFTNQYALLAGVDVGVLKFPGDAMGTLFFATLDPNCTLPFLVDDDPGYTNRQYIFGSFSFQAEDGVVLKLSQWAIGHEYYAAKGGVGSATSLGGSSMKPEFITFADCILNL